MRYSQYEYSPNMKKSRINTIIIWIAGVMWLLGIIKAGIVVGTQSIDFFNDWTPTVDTFFIVGVMIVAVAIVGLVLFLLRKRAGWILFVIALLVGVGSATMLYISKIVHYLQRVKEFGEHYGHEYPNDFKHIQSLVIEGTVIAVLAIFVMWIVTLWFIHRRSLCEIYGVNRKTIVYTCCGAAVLFALNVAIKENLFRSAERATEITQIESGEQIVARYNRKKDKIGFVEIPFGFEYRNRSLRKRQIGLASNSDDIEYKQKDWELFENSSWQGWEEIFWVKYKIGDELKDKRDLRFRERFIDRFSHVEFVAHRWQKIDTTAVSQAQFGSWLEQMRRTGVDSVCLGTLREFSLQHPDLAEWLLKGDSIRFNIYNRWSHQGSNNTWEATVTLPVKYQLQVK